MFFKNELRCLEGFRNASTIRRYEHQSLSYIHHTKHGKLYGPFIAIPSITHPHQSINAAAFPVFNRGGISTDAIGRFLTKIGEDVDVFYTPTPPAHTLGDTLVESLVAWSSNLPEKYIATSGEKGSVKIQDPDLVMDIQNKIIDALAEFSEEEQKIYRDLMKATFESHFNDSGLEL